MALRGRSMSLGSNPDDAREAIMGKLGDTNMQKGGLTFGKVAHGESVGAFDACYATVVLAAGQNVYTVSHTLQHIPGFVKLVDSSNTTTPASHYSVIAWSKGDWTRNTVMVRVESFVGNLAGGRITLEIGGS